MNEILRIAAFAGDRDAETAISERLEYTGDIIEELGLALPDGGTPPDDWPCAIFTPEAGMYDFSLKCESDGLLDGGAACRGYGLRVLPGRLRPIRHDLPHRPGRRRRIQVRKNPGSVRRTRVRQQVLRPAGRHRRIKQERGVAKFAAPVSYLTKECQAQSVVQTGRPKPERDEAGPGRRTEIPRRHRRNKPGPFVFQKTNQTS